jgi:undecaprenyl-diphosphatase
VTVHVATLLSVVIAYRRRIGELIGGMLRGGRDAWRYVGLLVIGSLPAGLAGVFLKDYFERTFHSLPALGWQFLVTAALLWSTKWAVRRSGGKAVGNSANREDHLPSDRPTALPSFAQALIIGIAQAVAIIPAISRSGATIAAGLWTGLSATVAAEFSFILSIIVIAASGVLEVPNLVSGSQPITPGLVTAFLAAGISGLAAISFLVALLRKGKFHYFAPYCVVVGLLCLFWFAF